MAAVTHQRHKSSHEICGKSVRHECQCARVGAFVNTNKRLDSVIRHLAQVSKGTSLNIFP